MLAIGLGVVVGIIMALTGAGGGILAVPLLVFALGLTMSQAGPIGLLAVGIAAALGALIGFTKGLVRYRAAALMAIVGMLCSPVGIWLAGYLQTDVLASLFTCVLLLVAYRTYQQSRESVPNDSTSRNDTLPCNLNVDKNRFVWTTRCAKALAALGGFAGFLSGLLGVGGGFIIVPALQRFTDLPIKSVIATSLAVIALVSVSGVFTATMSGAMLWNIAIPFCGGTFIGMLSGNYLSKYFTGPRLQQMFAAVAFIVAIAMAIKTVFALMNVAN